VGQGVLGHISKGIVLTKLDALLNHTDGKGQFDKRAAFLAALKAQAATPDDYRNILVAQAGVTADESKYLGDTWYGTGPKGWWQGLQPVYPIVRQGLIKAIEEAGDKLLVDSYWLPAASDGILEVIVARSERQVTRIILTPSSPAPTMLRHTDAPMWVVKRKMGNEQPSDATNNEVVESVLGDVVTWREREFP